MPRIPHKPPTNPQERLMERLAAMERRLAALERNPMPVAAVTATPTTEARDGTLAVQATPRLWVRVNGVWRHTGLT